MAFGKSRSESSAAEVPTLQPSQSSASGTEQVEGQLSQERLDTLRQQIAEQGGLLTDEQRAQFRQQVTGDSGQGGFIARGPGAGGIAGTVEQVEGNLVTVNTPQGPLQVTVSEETLIQRFAQGTVADLQAGMQVTIAGQRNEDGVQAQSILITPEGSLGMFRIGSPPGSQADHSGEPAP
jgi:hypothetical protein